VIIKVDNNIREGNETEWISGNPVEMKDFVRTLIKVSIVIPVHNEEKFIGYCINSLQEYINSRITKYNVSILIAEDGSTDSTLKVITDLASKYDNITIRHNHAKLGRGRAVKESWRSANADIYAYLDADLATSISYLNVLLETCDKGFDVVTGSRYVSGSSVVRPVLRKIVSKAYNHLINLVFRTSVSDHQCGFKAVTKLGRDTILKNSIFDDWFWDTEIFVIARRNGLSICEFPIEWQERRNTKTPLKRLLKDILIHGSGILILLIGQRRGWKKVRKYDKTVP
jgi:glycosyltransferase involved in cell wall biosynthesis